MQTSKSSRETILGAIRSSLPKNRVEHPRIPFFQRSDERLKTEFERHLQEAGGVAYHVATVAEAEAKLMTLHSGAKVICSAVSEIAGTRKAEDSDPHEFADVDVGIVRAQFGVAESGAVWLTQEDLVVDALAFLSQHLIVLLDSEQIVSDMHEAYRRVQLNKTAFGCFMMGPSATADVEATLVHGAQGARSLNIFFLPFSQAPVLPTSTAKSDLSETHGSIR
jgi:L-lactate dehydrogenase complex protein LldG